jgi:hypothetical protein
MGGTRGDTVVLGAEFTFLHRAAVGLHNTAVRTRQNAGETADAFVPIHRNDTVFDRNRAADASFFAVRLFTVAASDRKTYVSVLFHLNTGVDRSAFEVFCHIAAA